MKRPANPGMFVTLERNNDDIAKKAWDLILKSSWDLRQIADMYGTNVISLRKVLNKTYGKESVAYELEQASTRRRYMI